MKFEIDADPGFIDVTIAGKTIAIDIYKVWGQLTEIEKLTGIHEGGSPSEYWEAVVKLLETVGFPAVSHFVAEKFQRWHAEVRANLGKVLSGDSTPASPDSTASEPSTSTPPGS